MRDLVRARIDAMMQLMRARQQLLAFLLRHRRSYETGKNWTLRHRRWLAGQAFEQEAHRVVFQDYVEAVWAARFRRGWFLGDGTGADKGRQVAAIILDNWRKGRRRALWISKSDKLIEDAERDWTAIGGYRSDLVPLSRFRQGAAITLDEGNVLSRPAYDAAGNPVISREAVECRDRMIEHLASLPPVQGALDQILHRFGTDLVAEVTGRSRRIVKRDDRLCVETRPASANFAETAAFMDDDKRVLIFSDTGGTGRSYHADLGCRNQRRRIHYLLEPGWKADAAIQGLGRSNRTNQKQPPCFARSRPTSRARSAFCSTIARRLDTLGAITRGQRQTGGQGLFRADDNLESPYAKAALRQFYQLLRRQDRGLLVR